MKTDKLASMYDTLAPEERLPLIMAACKRDDRVERDRLVRSAPRSYATIADYDNLASAYERFADRYVMRQLEMLVRFLQASGHVDEPFADKEAERTWRDVMSRAACDFTANAQALRQLCSDRAIDAVALLGSLPGVALLNHYGPVLQALAIQEDEDRHESDPSQATADEVADAMSKMIATWAGSEHESTRDSTRGLAGIR